MSDLLLFSITLSTISDKHQAGMDPNTIKTVKKSAIFFICTTSSKDAHFWHPSLQPLSLKAYPTSRLFQHAACLQAQLNIRQTPAPGQVPSIPPGFPAKQC